MAKELGVNHDVAQINISFFSVSISWRPYARPGGWSIQRRVVEARQL
ncbi:hypothetical protein JNW88_11015 [Micromonospora sp. ATA32]|nr:hypothetical protein [Micromonospora sp. ATA32]